MADGGAHPMNALADLERGWTLRGDCAPVAFTQHALRRAGERLAPALAGDDLQRALCRMLASTRVTKAPPEWLAESQPADAWLLLGPDLAAPLHWRNGELRAATLIAAGSMSPERRERRNDFRARRASARRAAKRGGGPLRDARRADGPESADSRDYIAGSLKRGGRGREPGPAGPSTEDWDGE